MRKKGAPLRVWGRRSVWSSKVDLHYKRLLQPARQEGLWKWRLMALALRESGMAVQSGTTPVERFWASVKEMLPDAARLMSSDWFDVLSALIFLRYNYRHFHQRLLPSWSESDALLAERIENLAHAARGLHSDELAEGPACLCKPFL